MISNRLNYSYKKGEPMPKVYTIKELRLSLRITQEEFAESIGTKWTVVSKWERGIHKPLARTIRKIELKYKVKLNY